MMEIFFLIFGTLLSVLFVIVAAILNAYMDKWMQIYINLPKGEQQKVNKNWFSFNPLAKWKDGKWGVERAYNILILKYFHIRTKWLTDNSNDGWHTFKSFMILSWSFAVICFGATFEDFGTRDFWVKRIIMLIVLGIAWNVPFNKTLNNK